MNKSNYILPAVLLLALLSGCARYDFQILKPDRLSQRITQIQTRVNTPHMVYDMVAKENRLVVQIFNQGDTPVQLLGARSFVVDPKGASHPLPSQTLAPKSYAKLILPPLRPRFEQNPQFQLGVGTIISDAGSTSTPLYMDRYEDADNRYWDWDGQGPIRLGLTYQLSGGEIVTDEFTIMKVEAK